MIKITIDVTNATEKEIAEINKIYEKPINQLSKDAMTSIENDTFPMFFWFAISIISLFAGVFYYYGDCNCFIVDTKKDRTAEFHFYFMSFFSFVIGVLYALRIKKDD
ncbi:hypothetical protein N5912_00670 [Arcobacter lacus]|uniref:hypothetical protein n=1 Tax=Arcobacter lacus TaxID=1912876 RepID=UPI0021BAE6AD|nr:hypothetical protein [Arcobacter lacus]MCT7910331.1 hypothetical protein [Arcobacter lacus]